MKGEPVGLSRRGVLAGGALAAAALAGASCSKSGGSNKTSSSKTPDKVDYMTGVGTFGREGYVFVAQKMGYFKDVNIEVTVHPGNAGDFNINALETGKAHFAAVDFAKSLTAMATGHDKIRIVDAVYQHTVISILTLDGTGITNPSDLRGKTIGQAPGAIFKRLFPTYAKLAGFDGTNTKWVEFPGNQLPSLLASKKIDAMGEFVMTGPTIEQAAHDGRKAIVLPYDKYFKDLYGTVTLAMLDLTQQKPDLVKRFVSALMKGSEYAINNPTEAGKMIHDAAPTTAADVAAGELSLVKGYCTVGTGAMGQLDEMRVMRGISLMESAGQVAQGALTPDKVVAFNVAPKP
jgi:NitT/TauT family transport system substrate-binding protein